MQKRTRFEVTIETNELLMIRKRGKDARILCSECGERAMMITLEEAIVLASASSRVIHRWAEGGRIHFAETNNGFLLVCVDTLLGALS